MARLLLAGLLGLALVLLTVADEEDGQDKAISGHDTNALERHQRSADPGKTGKKKSITGVKKTKETKTRNKEQKKGDQTKKRGGKNKKGNKKRNGKEKKKAKKVNGKNKKRKQRKIKKDKNSGKSKTVRKNKKRKSKIGKGIQKKKGMKEKKQGKEKRKDKKNKKKTKKEKKTKISKDSTCLPLVCIDNAVKALNMLKGKVFSFEKQLKRFGKMSGQAEKKVGKKGVFKPTLMRLLDQGGGNASGLSCGGNLTNAGALQMQNLSSQLTACEGEVHDACHESNHPAPNATELSACVAAIDHFKNFTKNCTSQESASSACDCWDADDATSKVMAELKACNLKELSDNHTSAVKSCKSAFGKCRKYEDAVSDVVHACNQDPDALKKKLKNLSVNKAEMDKILSTMSAALRSLRSAPGNRVSVPGTRQATASSFLLVVTQITVLVSQNPVSYSIFTLAITISTVSVSFSSADMAQLTSLEASMSAAVTTMASEISVVSSTITSLTGEVLTDADIDDLDVCESDEECNGDVAGTTVEPTTTPQPTTTEASETTTVLGDGGDYVAGGDGVDGYGYGEGEEPVLITAGEGEEPVLITGFGGGEEPILITGFGHGEEPILINGFGEQPVLIPGYGGYGSEFGSGSGYGAVAFV